MGTALPKDVNITNTTKGKVPARGLRVYVIINTMAGCSDGVVRTLRYKLGVVIADILESQSSVIMMVEAPEQQKLVELTIEALASVEMVTEGVHLMPARNYPASMTIVNNSARRRRKWPCLRHTEN